MSLNPNDVVIVDAVRTPMGKSRNGQFRHVRAEKLSSLLVEALMERNPNWDIQQTEDVIWGCVNQTKEQGMNIARNISMLAGLPRTSAAQTVNRHGAVAGRRRGRAHRRLLRYRHLCTYY